MAERARRYEQTPEDVKYARAARASQPGGGSRRVRSYVAAVLIVVMLVAGALFLHGGLLNPKTHCTTTTATVGGVVSVDTHCRSVRSFP